MITLNTEKGLIKIETWDDIESRPGFVKDLDPSTKKLDSIIGRYIFKEKIRCGLSNCHTPHAKGYIVTTTDGHETNIGKDCGKTYFGVDFQTLSRKFDRDVKESENRERLWSFSFQLEELEKKINEIRSGGYGANWVHKYSQRLVTLNKGCPEEVAHRLTSMVKNRNSILTTQRIASDQEVEDIEAIEDRKVQRPHYVEERVAEISGVEVLYPENDLRQLLVKDLESNLKDFKEKDISSMSYEELRQWAKWIGTVDTTFERAEVAVAQGRKLLNEDNLTPFLEVLEDREDIKQFRDFMKNIGNV